MNPTTTHRPLSCLKSALRHERQLRSTQQRSMATAVHSSNKPTPKLPPGVAFHGIQDNKAKKLRTGFAIYGDPATLAALSSRSLPSPERRQQQQLLFQQQQRLRAANKPLTKQNIPQHQGGSNNNNNNNNNNQKANAKPTNPALVNPKLLLPRAGILARPVADPLPAHHALQIRNLDPTGSRTRLFARDNKDGVHVGDVLTVATRRSAEPFAGVCISIRRRGIDTAILVRGQITKIGVELWFKIYSRTVTGIEIAHRRQKRARRARLTYMRKPEHDMGNVDELVRQWRRTRNVFVSSKSIAVAKANKAAEARIAKKKGEKKR